MTGTFATLWGDVKRGVDAPLRLLMLGMLAAFVISLPITVALNFVGLLASGFLYALTGAIHALATFWFAGWMVRTGRG